MNKRKAISNPDARKINSLEDMVRTLEAERNQALLDKEAVLDGFIALRQAVEEEGYEVFINGHHKPLHTDETLSVELSKYFGEAS